MRMRKAVWLAVVMLGALGCGGDPDPEDPAAQKVTYCYGTTDFPPSSPQVDGIELCRIFDGPNSQILERETVYFSSPRRVFFTGYTYQVTGSRFEDPAHRITGSLRGEPWKWTEWTKWTRNEDGSGSVSTSTLDPLKIIIDTTFLDAQGNVVSTSHREMDALPQNP
jgi:hypothetical protein